MARAARDGLADSESPSDSNSEGLWERKNALLEALAELPERDRAVLSLRYGGELSAPEVAQALGLSAANVRKICERRRAELLAKLAPLGSLRETNTVHPEHRHD